MTPWCATSIDKLSIAHRYNGTFQCMRCMRCRYEQKATRQNYVDEVIVNQLQGTPEYPKGTLGSAFPSIPSLMIIILPCVTAPFVPRPVQHRAEPGSFGWGIQCWGNSGNRNGFQLW